jgi:sodium-dependent dicarboxylate transporter 2/3/5
MANSTEETVPEGLCRAGRWLAVIVFLAVLWSPKPSGLTLEAWRLVAVTGVMAVLWFTQGVPMAVTGLIPLVFYPLLGIRSADLVAKSYIESNTWLALGGFMMGLGIERWGLHRRMALHILCWLGTSPRGIVLGFMLGTGFVSMWISNTAATLMMLPIGVALLKTLEEIAGGTSSSAESSSSSAEAPGMSLLGSDESRMTMPSASSLVPNALPWLSALGAPLMMGIAYGASIGGVATPVGTLTNVAFLGIWAKQFPDAPRASSGAWIISFTPLAAVMLLGSWFVLTWYLPWRTEKHWMNSAFFRRRLEKIGRPKRGEIAMFMVFGLTALMWVFRPEFRLGTEPLFIGWTKWLELALPRLGWTGFKASFVDDATISIGMCLLMFFIPIEKDSKGRTSFLMDWPTANKLPWDLILLFGSGFAIAEAFRATKLELWVGESIATLVTLRSPLIWVIIVAASMTFLSEFTSNVATANMFLPILAAVSVSMGIDPRMLMLPATIAVSFSFMLPAGTPPNAIVFGTGRIRIDQMVKYGFVLNCLGIVLVSAFTMLWMVPWMGIAPDQLPAWAETK